MKKILATTFLSALPVAGALLSLPFCCEAESVYAATAADGAAKPDAPPGQEKVVIPVRGMTCGGCEAAVKVAVRRLDGVVAVEADHKAANATVTYVKDKVTVEKIVEAINKTGFKAEVPEQDKKPG